MELNNLLRPKAVAKQTTLDINRIEDQLFNAYQQNLLHQIYDAHETQELRLPLDQEGMGHGIWIYEDELQELIWRATRYDRQKPKEIADKLVALLENAGWQFLEVQVEDGEMSLFIDQENTHEEY